jgi:predicted SAM-dependent methyltransferase
VEKNQAIELLKECHRILRPGGVMRVSMPDLTYLLKNYFLWRMNGVAGKEPIPDIWEPLSPCDMVNEGMRMWEHKYLWDKEELTNILTKLRFKQIIECPWHLSVDDELKNLEVRPYFGELIVEFTK